MRIALFSISPDSSKTPNTPLDVPIVYSVTPLLDGPTGEQVQKNMSHQYRLRLSYRIKCLTSDEGYPRLTLLPFLSFSILDATASHLCIGPCRSLWGCLRCYR